MDITITLLGGKSFLLNVAPETTVSSLKHLILESFQLSPGKLSYDKDKQKINLNDGSRSLSSYGVPPGANILMLLNEPNINVEIFLRTEKGETHAYTVRPGETVAGFKLMIKQRERVAVDQQRLIHEGKQLDDESRTLESYNVRALSTIFLTGRLRGGEEARTREKTPQERRPIGT